GAASCPLVIGPDDEDEFVVCDNPAAQAAWRVRPLDETQISIPGADLVEDVIAVCGSEHDLDGRFPAAHGGSPQRHQPARQELLSNSKAGAYPDLAAAALP